jgi:hypothetical protein
MGSSDYLSSGAPARSIFNAGDIKKQLPGESAKFQEIVSRQRWIWMDLVDMELFVVDDMIAFACVILFFELDVCINLKLRHPHFIGTVLLFIFSICLWVRDDASSGGQGCTMAADHEGPGPPSRKQHPLVIQKPRLLRESRSK